MAIPALLGTPTTATNISDGASLGTPSSAASGEWLLAVLTGRTFGDGAAGTNLTLTDFTVMVTGQSTDDNNYRATFLKKEVDATDISGTTYDFGSSSATGPIEGGAIIYRCDTEPVFDVSAVDSSFGTDITIPNPTTTGADRLALAAMFPQGGGGAQPAPPSPWTDQAEATGYIALGARDVATAGAVGGQTWTGLSFGSYWAMTAAFESGTPAAALTQEGYRWGTDDGSESAHGWEAAQDNNPSSLAAGTTTLLRVLVDETAGGPVTDGYRLQVKRTDEAADQWRDVT